MTTRSKPTTIGSGWVGWIYFGGTVLLATGIVHIINGLIALTRSSIAVPTASGTLVPVSLSGLGLSLLIAGIVLAAAGAGLFTGRTWARMLGMTLAVLSILGNIAVFMAFPVWSTVVIVLDLMVLYALSAHWHGTMHS
jgi:hypothetical protein